MQSGLFFPLLTQTLSVDEVGKSEHENWPSAFISLHCFNSSLQGWVFEPPLLTQTWVLLSDVGKSEHNKNSRSSSVASSHDCSKV